MAGLQRFISYIYKYENDEKKATAGFAKVEVRGNTCRIEVHIRNIIIEQSEGIVYLFARKDKNIQGIPVGNIPISRGNGDVRYTFELNELMHFGISMHQAEGIYISLVPGYYLASQWKEGEIAEARFQILEKRENEAELHMKEQVSKESVVESEEEKQEAQESQNMDDHVQKAEEDTIHTTELPMEEYFEDSRWARTFQKMRLKSEIFYPFEGQNIECIRMEIKDIHEFPEKYWYLGNNSFLLHGFFQYGYFVLGCQSCSKSADNLLEETDETSPKEYFIGVPGVFQNPERMMATMFGFPEFRAAKKSEYKTGNFGYWYRII